MAEPRVEFKAALAAGLACLHPTDTLPGLAFDPRQPRGLAAIAAIKGRDINKPCLGLAADLAAASRYFAPLPGDWSAALATLWPGPLSVVWRASRGAPPALVGKDGTIGLRVPLLPEGSAWLAQVLSELPYPLPTTSVNASGEPAIAEWDAATRFLTTQRHVFAPVVAAPADSAAGQPSTVIRILPDATYEVLRAGAVPRAAIDAALQAGRTR